MSVCRSIRMMQVCQFIEHRTGPAIVGSSPHIVLQGLLGVCIGQLATNLARG